MFCVCIGDICSPVYIRVTCVLLYLLLYLAMAQGGLDSAPTVDRTSKPLYLKNNDLRGTSRKQFTDFDLIDPIKRVIGDDLLCVQLTAIYGEFISKIPKADSRSLPEVSILIMYHSHFMIQIHTPLALRQHLKKP